LFRKSEVERLRAIVDRLSAMQGRGETAKLTVILRKSRPADPIVFTVHTGGNNDVFDGKNLGEVISQMEQFYAPLYRIYADRLIRAGLTDDIPKEAK
jgi:hypothetical protein